jgi:hypothetical protein
MMKLENIYESCYSKNSSIANSIVYIDFNGKKLRGKHQMESQIVLLTIRKTYEFGRVY